MSSDLSTELDTSWKHSASSSDSVVDPIRALKRKRAVNDFGSSATLHSTIDGSKRHKRDGSPGLSSSQADGPLWSATTAPYVPGQELQTAKASGNLGVRPSNREPSSFFKKPSLDLHHKWHESPTSNTTDEGADRQGQKNVRALEAKSMTIVERKGFFLYTPTEHIQVASKKYFSDMYQVLDMSGSNEECRLHPTPPYFSGKPAGRISFTFDWKAEYRSHQLYVEWGIIALLVREELTAAQKDGFVNKSWRLSHLCGNWTCCNWRHFTVESRHSIHSRNACFKSPAKCTHNPPCLKEKKRQLLVTDYIRDKISKAITSLGSILSYEAFHTLPECDIRLVEWFWANSKRSSCAFCGRSDDKAHICSCLSSLVNCKVMLRALKLCIKPTLELIEAIGYLVKITEDLERSCAVKSSTLTECSVGPRESEASQSVELVINDTSQREQKCRDPGLTHLRFKNVHKKRKKTRLKLRSSLRQPESAVEDVALHSKLMGNSHKLTQ